MGLESLLRCSGLTDRETGKTDSIPSHPTLAGTIRVAFTEVRLRAQVPVEDPGRRYSEVLDSKPIAQTDLCITLGALVPREPSRSPIQPLRFQLKNSNLVFCQNEMAIRTG
jgi:hypothetical protein